MTDKPTARPAERPVMPPLVTTAVVAFIFLINIGILVYAVRSAMPSHAEARIEQASIVEAATPAPASATNGATNGSAVRSSEFAVANIVLPGQEETARLYVQYCSACHGVDGRGRGPAAEQLYPKPRDFVASPFRFASTTGDRDQIVSALERTITQGVARSAMPGFGGVLTESQVAGLARHVLSLREKEGGVAAGELHVDIGRHPPFTRSMIERGRELYTSLGCITCHGESGHGDGPGSMGLFDTTNRPVKPADLASGLYKSGQTPESIARTILAGVPGTPMTPFESMLIKSNGDGAKDSSDVWALVAYIQSLAPRPQSPGIASGANVPVYDAPDDAMLDDPSHIAWLGVPETIVGVRPLWQREETTNTVRVRAVRTRDRAALCLEWEDDSLDYVRDMSTFSDGVAVMFALGEEAPALPMGVSVQEHKPTEPVNIWHWRADRQVRALADLQEPSETDADTASDDRWYLFSNTPAARVPAITDPSAMTFDAPSAQDPRFATAGAAGNELALDSLTSRAALEANAIGFGTLTLQEEDSQDVTATAAWSQRAWRVLMVRSLETIDSQDVQFTRSNRIPVAFAVWNGSKGDRAGVKLISSWHWLDLSVPSP